MNQKLFFSLLGLLISMQLTAQVKIGDNATAIDTSALFEMESTAKGLLISRVDSTQRSAIVLPAEGLLVYQTDGSKGFYYYNGSNWTRIGDAVTESDPVYIASQAANITAADITNLSNLSGTNTGDQNLSIFATKANLEDSTAQLRTEIPDVSGFLSSETDPKMQTITSVEVDQLEEIGGTTISATQWGYLGGLTDVPLTANFYTDDGSLGASRTVTMSGNNLIFDGTGDVIIQDDGNVGIGTTSPDEQLHVAGNMRLNGAFEDKDGAAGTIGQILSSTGTGTDWIVSPAAGLWTQSSSDIYYDAGKVAIGRSTFGLQKLNVTTTSNLIGLYVENNGSYSTFYATNNGSGNAGTFMGSVQIADGTQGDGKVFTSAANGLGSWEDVTITAPLALSGKDTGIIKGTYTTNGNYGYLGSVDYGVYGIYTDDGHYGALGTTSEGVYGIHSSGCYGLVGTTSGVYGIHSNGNNYGHVGDSYRGVYGSTTNGYGIAGYATSTGTGVYGFSSSGDAGYFNGTVDITGTLSKGGGSFKIDHPLDPANKYLYHSFVESPDMMNVYNGNVSLNQNGEAIVELPAYFEALNNNFRYQLTAIGAPGPNLYIAEEISGNSFKIAGGSSGMKVSWQVTGVRQDAFAKAHRIKTEVDKEADKKGKYIHPVENGKSKTLGINYDEELRMLEDQRRSKAEYIKKKAEYKRVMKK